MTAPTRPVLSICIPTYNRSELLLGLLREMDRPDFLPFPFDVAVSDNASPDPGYQAVAAFKPVHYDYAYVRRPANIGGSANMAGCYRLARGEFCLHLADDDRLIAPEVAAIITEMRRVPELLAIFAPYEAYDRAGGTLIAAPSFENFTVGREESATLIDRLTAGNLAIPEFAIYRTAELGAALYQTAFAYFPYQIIARLLMSGPIRFHDKAYYRGIGQHEGETAPRNHASADFGLAGWGGVARGFALLAHWAQGGPLYEPATRPETRLFLTFFRNALAEANNRARFLDAFELMEYLTCLGGASLFADEERARVRSLAYLDAVRHELDKLPGVTTAHLIGLGELTEPLSQIFRANNSNIRLVASPSVMEVDPDGAAFVTPSDAMRDQLISLYRLRPGFVFSLEGARRSFGI
jgi:glycosyltransferase involved in cell wall biosynthesis